MSRPFTQSMFRRRLEGREGNRSPNEDNRASDKDQRVSISDAWEHIDPFNIPTPQQTSMDTGRTLPTDDGGQAKSSGAASGNGRNVALSRSVQTPVTSSPINTAADTLSHPQQSANSSDDESGDSAYLTPEDSSQEGSKDDPENGAKGDSEDRAEDCSAYVARELMIERSTSELLWELGGIGLALTLRCMLWGFAFPVAAIFTVVGRGVNGWRS